MGPMQFTPRETAPRLNASNNCVILNLETISDVHLLPLAVTPIAPARVPLSLSLATIHQPLPPKWRNRSHKEKPMASLTLSEKLDQLDARYQQMTQELSTPEVVTDSARFQKLAKQHSDLETIVNKHREFKQIEKDLATTHQMVVDSEDAEVRHMAQEEEKLLAVRKEQTERELKLLLLPHD